MTHRTDSGLPGARLAPCPDTPNCVSSRAEQASQRVEPFPCVGSCRETLKYLEEIVGSMTGAAIVETGPSYLRAEFTTLLFRFVDDLELQADADEGVIHVRSASRRGTWDLGLNRRRVESLRRQFAKRQR